MLDLSRDDTESKGLYLPFYIFERVEYSVLHAQHFWHPGNKCVVVLKYET